ncbi:restriction endonuclease subunit S [Microbulbifer epialgicus]|uniref:Restriction endonuclease subunit S n=1 Tax=Microbulbifer epialgicus TaxID=393907 RepID=A0ABV4P4L9_9GAMM
MNSELPCGWEKTPLSTLVNYAIGGDWGKAPDKIEDGFSEVFCIRGAEFRNWGDEKGRTASLRVVKDSSLLNRMLVQGDILVEISGGGPEQPVGRTVLIDNACLSHSSELPKIPTNFLRLIRTTKWVSSEYLNLYLTFFYNSGEVVNYQAGSNNLRNLKFNDYIGISIPLPPQAEQGRILLKVEELFSELDSGIESLKTAREQLKVYRQSLLKHAFEGRLTEQWRKDNADKLESAEELLVRIQQEREARYQQQLMAWEKTVSKWKADDKRGKKPAKPKVLKDIPIDADYHEGLPEIIMHWSYSPLGRLIDDPKYGTSKKCGYDSGQIGVLRIPNIASGVVDASDLKFADFDEGELQDYQLLSGDVLIVRSNGSVSLVGKGAKISCDDEKYIYAGYLIRLRPNTKLIEPDYLLFGLEYHGIRKQIEGKAKSTSGVNNINSGELQSLIFPICTIGEQKEIVAHLERNLSINSAFMDEVDQNIKRSEALRQSILKKAFSGQLVPQDPSDEPASELLNRIAEEKAEIEAAAKAAKATAKKAKPKKPHAKSKEKT